MRPAGEGFDPALSNGTIINDYMFSNDYPVQAQMMFRMLALRKIKTACTDSRLFLQYIAS